MITDLQDEEKRQDLKSGDAIPPELFRNTIYLSISFNEIPDPSLVISGWNITDMF